jgi:hypothetical protein
MRDGSTPPRSFAQARLALAKLAGHDVTPKSIGVSL